MTKMLARLMAEPHLEPHPRARQEDDEARRASCWRFVKRWEEHAKGMFVPVDAVRGTRLPLHRPDRRPRHSAAGLDPAQRCKELKGPQLLHVVTTQGQRLSRRPKREQIEYHAVGPFDPGRPASSRRPAPRNRRIPRSSATGCATWPRPIRAWSASRRRCAKARAWCASRASSRSAISMSASPNSTR